MPADTIKNIIVLMLENRSFDHMLGHLRTDVYPIEGLTGSEFNREDPGNSSSAPVSVNSQANYTGDLALDPYHDITDVSVQLFGTENPPPGQLAANKWFIFDYARVSGNTVQNAHKIMNCFDPAKLPALTTLAQEFAVCDHWYSSVPGQTWPNRFFVHAATSDGSVDNKYRYYGMRTIYDNLTAEGISWNIYFHDVPQSLALARLQLSLFKERFKLFDKFKSDAQRAELPSYSFIEPCYHDFLAWKANDQHPDHDVSLGDALIADVYEAIRNSPQWDQSLLVILWDEHGGIFDHAPPPQAVNPDGKSSALPEFKFDRLGVRVPAVLVSPYIAKRTIDSTTYDHTSLLATVKKLFNLPAFLTERDANAATFENDLSLNLPRPDTPASLARVTGATALASMDLPMTQDKIRQAIAAKQVSQRKPSEFQRSLNDLVDALDTGESHYLSLARAARVIETEHEAAVHARESVARFLGL